MQLQSLWNIFSGAEMKFCPHKSFFQAMPKNDHGNLEDAAARSWRLGEGQPWDGWVSG